MQAEDEAVSPVIGTILLVAIAVVLAAVLAINLRGQADDTEPVPPLGLRDNHDGTFTVVRIGGTMDYDDLRFGGCDVTAVNGQALDANATVSGGDRWSTDCLPGDAFTVSHGPTNSLLGVFQFT